MRTSANLAAKGDDGVYLSELALGERLEIRTQNRAYRLVNCGHGQVLVSGHPEYCPTPTLVNLNGSTWGGSMLKMGFMGRGMHLEFQWPNHHMLRTSPVVDIRRVAAPWGLPDAHAA